jgi:alanine racemase
VTIDDRLDAAGLAPLPRRAWLEVDLGAIANNVAVFRELVGPDVELNAVVKADAYGHGMLPVARAVERAGVDRLCVATLDEAVALRESGIRIPILVLFAVPAAGLPVAVENSIEVSVTAAGELLDGVTHNASGDRVTYEVEIDTGLTRAGFKPDDLARVIGSTQTDPRPHVPAGLWTHMSAPEDEAVTAAQVSELERAIGLVHPGRASTPPVHAAATGGVFTGRVPSYQGVRIGLGLYGLLPLDLPIAEALGPFAARLKPAMELKAMPLRVETVPAGTRVGYGGTWIAPRESVIATLPVGYGDGWARAYSPGAQALVRGARVPLVGTVAMDAVMVDVTDIPGVGVNDEFVLIGRQGREFIGVEELARLRNTIPWEVVTSMSFRLPRVYHAASVLMGLRTLAGEMMARTEAVE